MKLEIKESVIRRSVLRYLGQKLGADDRKRDEVRDRTESIVRQVDKDKGIVR